MKTISTHTQGSSSSHPFVVSLRFFQFSLLLFSYVRSFASHLLRFVVAVFVRQCVSVVFDDGRVHKALVPQRITSNGFSAHFFSVVYFSFSIFNSHSSHFARPPFYSITFLQHQVYTLFSSLSRRAVDCVAFLSHHTQHSSLVLLIDIHI